MAKVVRKPGPAVGFINVAVKDLDRVVEKVGWFETAHYPNGTPVALVAAVQEFGWPEHNIPPRLGMRATADAKREEWGTLAARGARAAMAGKWTVVEVFGALGLKAAGDLRKHITEVTQPPLKVDTVKARLRGRDQGRFVSVTIAKPLVFTGHMLATLTNVTETR
jgi:hypothetical protein